LGYDPIARMAAIATDREPREAVARSLDRIDLKPIIRDGP
jgi:hypothetical protein